MLNLLRIGRLSALITTGVLIAGAQGARANDQDVRATTVPATACQPASATQAAEVAVSNGAWAFSGTNTGTITFYCPLPINGNTVSDATDDNDISAFRVYYRDTDGTGSAAEVTARLIFRTTGVGTIGSTWSSNSSNVMTDTMAYHLVTHDMSASAMYSFYVTLSRTSTAESPAFTGIDFASPPIP